MNAVTLSTSKNFINRIYYKKNRIAHFNFKASSKYIRHNIINLRNVNLYNIFKRYPIVLSNSLQ